ncbi:hypothetical protein SAMN05421688_1356 [Poseidonocella pacifica]|uniref:Replication restart DNA helicase PriA n=1 Tax=Poseidonocella pacifica TaxID=871651 RepID=A0A1I0WEJ5_9RHOB|nr:TFIIB-type zinc finger domain-containing protein [Poseidonocella pacifica]SFA87169.1 hypothetical protein SAMN05421688_1356 [Poseidonocella pacifica]
MNDTDHRFPCENCGGDYRYDPAASALVCVHCGHREEVSEASPWPGAIPELDFKAALRDQLGRAEFEETRVSACPNCGAQVEFDPDVHAAECPFCATPVVTDTGAHRHIKPRGILPFALAEPVAHEAMDNWLGSLWFAPNGLAQYARKGRKMQGIYVPYWTFDAQTRSDYSGQRGIHYYDTKTVVRDGKRETVRVRKTRWHRATGRVARFFDDVLVLASRSLPKRYTDALEPWDLSALEPYKPEFLAGFRAEGYQVELSDGFDQAREKMDTVIRRDIKFDIGGDAQKIDSVRTQVEDVTFKHILLPVWLAAYKYRGKSFRFVVNGRTGQVQGERPWSWVKITIAVIIGALLAGIVGFFAAQAQ